MRPVRRAPNLAGPGVANRKSTLPGNFFRTSDAPVIGETRPTHAPQLATGETHTALDGSFWQPVLTDEGIPLIRPTRVGDAFLSRSQPPRVQHCHGSPVFLGLRRQIVEPVPAQEPVE